MANLFPEVVMEQWTEVGEAVAEDSGVDAVFGRGWRFDYTVGEFILTPTGKVVMADGQEAWVEWCRKAMQTDRYRYLIYSRSYGHDLELLIGKGQGQQMLESDIERMVTEALSVDPRTAAVGPFAFQWGEDHCSFTCKITSTRNEEETLEGRVSA